MKKFNVVVRANTMEAALGISDALQAADKILDIIHVGTGDLDKDVYNLCFKNDAVVIYADVDVTYNPREDSKVLKEIRKESKSLNRSVERLMYGAHVFINLEDIIVTLIKKLPRKNSSVRIVDLMEINESLEEVID